MLVAVVIFRHLPSYGLEGKQRKDGRREGCAGRKVRRMKGREKDKNTRTDDFKTPGNEHSRKVIQAGLQPQHMYFVER